MKKGIRLFTTLMVCVAMALCVSCKKDEKVYVAKVQAETPDVTTTANAADISGTYSYVSTMKSVVVVYGKDVSLSSPQKATAEHTRDSYSVTINNLDPSTKYYYYCIFDTGYGASESEQRSFTTKSVSATAVTTSSVSNITHTTATCGGNVTSDGSVTVTARGVCWSTSQNPTVSDSHTTDGSGTGSFTSNITGLTANTTYYVRAYATNRAGTSYGEQRTFTTHDAIAGHEYVDLGLPSGLLWATCNVGADSPEGYGWYLMWGSVAEGGDSNCSWSNCPGNGGSSDYNATAFNTWEAANLTGGVLNPDVDAATANWGGGWRMPTRAEWQELYDNTTGTWTGNYHSTGVAGRIFTSKTDSSKSIFLPAAGCRDGTSLLKAGSNGYYWSSSLYSSSPPNAYRMGFYSGSVSPLNVSSRHYGFSVRPVR